MPGGSKQANSLHISVPPELPRVLKEYTKAVLRNQPDDVLGWSAKYFGEMCKNEKLEIGAGNDDDDDDDERAASSGLLEEKSNTVTLNGLKSINDNFKHLKYIPFKQLSDTWRSRGFSKLQFTELITVGEFYSGEVPRDHLIAVACSSMAANMAEAMVLTVEILGDEQEKIPFETFEAVYRFLVSLDGEISEKTVATVLKHFRQHSTENNGFVAAQDVSSSSCPPLR